MLTSQVFHSPLTNWLLNGLMLLGYYMDTYFDLLHQLVLLIIVCLWELVDLDFVLLDFSHDLLGRAHCG